jgi:hypothetical protein
MWAWEHADGTFELANVPFFAQDVSFRDIVAADIDAGELVFRAVVTPAGHSTVRVLVPRGADGFALLQPLSVLGCMVRESHIPGLMGVDVPPEVDYHVVKRMLERGQDTDEWGYEEGALAEPYASESNE